MRFRFPLWFAASLLLLSSAAYADPVMQQAEARGTFIAAVVPDQLPLAANVSGKITGFDVDVAEELAKRLGLPVRLVTPGWDKILSGNWGGQWDYAVASITPTPKRSEKLNFPALYRLDATVVVVRSDDKRMERPQDASGKTIGVKGKTTFERYLRHELSLDELGGAIAYVIADPKIVTFPGNEEALKALLAKKVDAAVTTRAIAEAARKNGQAIRILPGFLYFEPVAVATAKGDAEFDAKIAAAIEAMRTDGTLSRLSINWFGIDLGTIIP